MRQQVCGDWEGGARAAGAETAAEERWDEGACGAGREGEGPAEGAGG